MKSELDALDATPLKTIDLPEEIFLDRPQPQRQTCFGFGCNPTLTYSFVNLETLVDT